MSVPLTDAAFAQLFTEARTQNGWLPTAVSQGTLRRLYELVSLGPTSMNCQPMRLVFLTSAEQKQRLIPALSAGNVERTWQAPVTAIVAWDRHFFDELPKVWHRAEARQTFADNAHLAETTAFRNSSIQGGYLVLAARALGLDAGPMSGFDIGKVDAEFFPDGRWTANFLCNLGYGDTSKLFGRQPRLGFDEACLVL